MSAETEAPPAWPSRRSGSPGPGARPVLPAIGAVVVIAVLAYLPYDVYEGTTSLLVNFFILLILASMWNLLAGYAGLVSVGQQAFIGLGSYFVLIVGLHQRRARSSACPPRSSRCGVIGLVVWWLLSRLRSGYFAIATWVIASICYLIIIRFPSLGGGTGEPLSGLPTGNATLLDADIYWIALGRDRDRPDRRCTRCCAAGSAWSSPRLRDDETGARSVGARVTRAQLLVFVVAAVGCGAAGGLELISQPFVQPTAAFSVQWTAEMIFACLIGGIGTIEGPILGTIVFFALQQWLANYGTWYFIVLGAVAIAVAIWAPRGLWGLISERLNIRLFPVGYCSGRADQLAGRDWPGCRSPAGAAATRHLAARGGPACPAGRAAGAGCPSGVASSCGNRGQGNLLPGMRVFR